MSRLPKHVAIIMDGNGRWAQRRHRPRVYGHIRGASRVKAVVQEADRLGVKVLTLYAFSTENWSRPESELRVLWKLLARYLKKEVADLERNNVRLKIFGEVERLPAEVRQTLENAIERLSKNTGLCLCFAVSYGSRRELTRAAQLFAEDCAQGKAKPSEMSEAVLERYLWTSELGTLSDVDLVIRTSGEQRVSNFLLWQAAYAEFVFLEICWPDFNAEHFKSAIETYGARERRFGGTATLFASSAGTGAATV
jgi:undecaprenyl diphosphate synthase